MEHLCPPVRTTRFAPHRVLGVIALALVAAILGWAPAPPAAAHGELLSSDPSEGGLLQAMPSRAFLTFSDAILEVHEVTVIGPDGSVTNGDPTSVGAEVRQTLGAGPDGAYAMSYHVVSADGHEISGEINFEIGTLSVPVDDGGSEPEAAGEREDGLWRRGLDAAVPMALVLLSGAVALLLMRRQRS